MTWLLFSILACSFWERPAEKEPTRELKTSEAEYQSARSAPMMETNWQGAWKVQVWGLNPDDPSLVSLSAQLKAPIFEWKGEALEAGQGELILVYLPKPQTLPKMKGEVVFVLDGNWSKTEMAELPWKGGAIVDSKQTMALFGSEEYLADPQLKAGVVAWQIAEHYQLSRDRLDRAVPVSLYGILATEAPDSQHENPQMRYFAANSPEDSSMVVRLATARSSADQRVLALLAKDIDPWVRARAMDRLENVSLLREGLSDGSSLVRVVSGHQLAVLARMGKQEACEPLQEASRSGDAYLRWKGAYGLGFCESLPVLLALMDDADIDVQRQAAQSLGRQRNVAEAQDILIKKLESKNSFVRRWVLEALSQIQSKEVEGVLQQYFETTSSQIEKEVVAQALRMRGKSFPVGRYLPPSPPKNTKDLEQLITSKDPTVRKDAAKFLIGRKEFKTQLLVLTKDADSEVRKSAVEVLGWNGDSEIYQFLSDTDLDVVVTALDGIRHTKIGDGQGIELLLQHPDSEIRLRALQALVAVFGELSQKQKTLLSELCSDPDERIRASALMIFPKKMLRTEASDWLRWMVTLSEPMVYVEGVDDMASFGQKGTLDQKAWIRGVVEMEDDFLHRRFSWNDEKDRPPSHRALRPPLFREYGRPNRG